MFGLSQNMNRALRMHFFGLRFFILFFGLFRFLLGWRRFLPGQITFLVLYERNFCWANKKGVIHVPHTANHNTFPS